MNGTWAHDKVRIAHVITRFDKGGSAENTWLTVTGLDPTRYDVTLIYGDTTGSHTSDRERNAIEDNLSRARELGVHLIRCATLVRAVSPLRDLVTLLRLLHLFRRLRPLIVHTHTSKAGILGRWAAFFARVPFICHTPHGHVFWGYFGPLRTKLFKTLERITGYITNRVLLLTPQELADHQACKIVPREKCSVIHSGVDLSPFRPVTTQEKRQMRAEFFIGSTDFLIGTVGRLTKVKGHRHLLEAFARFLRHGGTGRCVLVGDGELRVPLENQARKLGIIDHITFLGWRPDVAAIIPTWDIFVFPSLNEGMGRAIVEAMACALPIIAHNVGGIRDLVTDGENGVLITPGDHQGLADAIMLLYRRNDLRQEMGITNHRKALAYTKEAMITRIATLYDEWIDRYRTSGGNL